MPLFWLSIAFMAGIVLSTRLQLPTSTWLVIAGISLILVAYITWRRNRSGSTRQIFNLPPQLFILILFSFACIVSEFTGQNRWLE